jgi:chromosome segregation ATPase
MKKILLFAVATVLAASCTQTGKNGTIEQADERIDSMQRVLDQKDNEINDMMSTFNEIQEGFRLIEADEEKVTLAKAGEGANQPEQIRQSMKNIQERMKRNKELIAKLQRQVREGSSRSTELKKMVENFTQELEEKNKELQELRAELEQKNIHIAELDKTVAELNTNVTELKEEANRNAETISNQDKELHTVYYVFGTKKELKANNIYQSGDVLKKDNFNKNYFTKADMRVDKEIKLCSKSAKILTTHPAGTYTLQQDAQKQYILRITNPEKFWSTSRYLVVMVK